MSVDNLKNKTALVIDNGLFFHFAEVLSRGFGKVLYWSPSITAFPKSNSRRVGSGFPNVHRVDERFEHFDEADILVYPDVGYGGEQVYWRNKGKAVWGSGYGEGLELERARTKKLLSRIGLPVGPYQVVNGLSSLRLHLQKHPNVWVKLSAMRGDAETFCSKSYELIEPFLDDLEVRLGPIAREQEFVVETQIDSDLEIGYDGYCVDGKFAKTGIVGIEVKDAAYIGSVQEYEKMTEFLKVPNKALGETFKKYQFRGLYSSEVRIGKDKTGYLIDPCCRAGSPPSEVYVEMYSNWADVVWGGSHGEMVEPKMVKKYGAELMLESTWAETKWQAVKVPKEIQQWVKWKMPCVIDEQQYVIPTDNKMSLIGAVVGLGDTPQLAIKQCLKHRELIQGYSLHSENDSFDEALEKVEVARKMGVNF